VDMRRALPDELISALSEFVAARTGLHFPPSALGAIWKAGLPLPPATSASRCGIVRPLAPVHTPGTQPYRNPRQPPDGRGDLFSIASSGVSKSSKAQILPELLPQPAR